MKLSEIFLQVIGPQMCTMNLHSAIRHAHEQESATGSTANSMEWFVEQHVGELKKRVAGMTREPQKVVGNDVLLEKALIDRVTEKPQFRAAIALGEEKEPEIFKGPTDVCEGGVQLLHVGQPLGVAQLGDDELASLQRHAEEVSFTTDVQRWEVHEHRAARVGDQKYQSRARYRAAARHSFNVTISWSSSQTKKETQHHATLERFLRVRDSASPGILRVAMGTVYKQARSERGLAVIDVAKPLRTGEVIPLESVLTKVVFAPHDQQQGEVYALPCFSQDL
jgi:hypothetical protein